MDDTYDIFATPLYSWIPCDPDVSQVRQIYKNKELNRLLENEENEKLETARFHHAEETGQDLMAPVNPDFEGQGTLPARETAPKTDDLEAMRERWKNSRVKVDEIVETFQRRHPEQMARAGDVPLFNIAQMNEEPQEYKLIPVQSILTPPTPMMMQAIMPTTDTTSENTLLSTYSFNSDTIKNEEGEVIIDRQLDEEIKKFIQEEGLMTVYKDKDTEDEPVVLKSDIKLEKFKDLEGDLRKLQENMRRLMVEEGLSEEEARARNRIQLDEPKYIEKVLDPDDVVPIPKKIEKHVKIEDQMSKLIRLKDKGFSNEQIRKIMSGDAQEEDFEGPLAKSGR